ncbi:MAG: AraC family transcriptional regulator [Deltaproteobacteria bacterium]|nr:AraC family transcriptional regulator [Deltaproteobacteria bacterium]
MSGHRTEIDRALAFVAAHLDRPLTLGEVAAVAGLSEHHFHRVFHELVGEPLGRFITRRRLELAALRVAYEPHRPIGVIALESGYSSLSNFTKAFTAHFGCSPSAIRGGSTTPAVGRLTSAHGKTFSPALLYSLPPSLDPRQRRERARALGVRHEEMKATPLVCLASPYGYDLAALDETWTTLLAHAATLLRRQGPLDAWGRAFDSPHLTAPEHQRYHACVAIDPLPAVQPPLFHAQVEPGHYAVFPYDGPVDGVEERWRTIFSCWVPESVVEPVDFVAIDRYTGDAPREGHVTMEMWLRVAPR